MAYDANATPTAVLRRYQIEIWNNSEVEKLGEIVANIGVLNDQAGTRKFESAAKVPRDHPRGAPPLSWRR